MKKLLTLLAIAALAGCSPTEAPADPEPTTLAPLTATSLRPTSVPVSRDLPSAPPLEQWIEKGNDFQQTLDLNMRTHLIRLGVAPTEATDTAARDLAYLVCATLRAGLTPSQAAELVRTAYPTVKEFDAIAIVVTAQAYCLDTVST